MQGKLVFWQKLKKNIITRVDPLTVCYWRFLLPNQTRNIRLHRAVFRLTYRNFPLPLRLFALSFNLAAWWSYRAWYSIFTVFNARGESCLEKYAVAKHRQILDLFCLAFVFCIPPREYYKNQLHNWPKNQWLDFTFNFQSAVWHAAFNRVQVDQSLLNDKLRFEKRLLAEGIPTIVSLLTAGPDCQASDSAIEQLPDPVFLKPRVGNRSEGCLTVKKDRVIEGETKYQFTWFKSGAIYKYRTLEDIKRIFDRQEYLIQPKIENSSIIEQLLGTRKLATIRLVTGQLGSKIVLLSCILEAPIPDKPTNYRNLQLDNESGKIMFPKDDAQSENSKFKAWFANLEYDCFPHWQNITTLCCEAHQLMPDLTTVGWDVAVTEQGPLIIEGNISWGFLPHQNVMQTPMLKTEFGDFYANTISNSA